MALSDQTRAILGLGGAASPASATRPAPAPAFPRPTGSGLSPQTRSILGLRTPKPMAAPIAPEPEPEDDDQSFIKWLAPHVARIGLPLAGGVLGSIVPGAGTAAGVAAGGAIGGLLGGGIGEAVAQKMEGRDLDATEIALSAGLSALPAGVAGRTAGRLAKEAAETGVRNLGKRAALHAAEGATQGVIGEAISPVVREGRAPTADELIRGAGIGTVLGGALGTGLDLAVSPRAKAPAVEAPRPAAEVPVPPPVWTGEVPPDYDDIGTLMRGREEVIADILRAQGAADVWTPPPPVLKRPSFVDDLGPAPDPGPEMGYGRGGVPVTEAPPIEDLIQRSLTVPPGEPRLGPKPAPVRGLGEDFSLSPLAARALSEDTVPPAQPAPPRTPPLVAEQPLVEPGVEFLPPVTPGGERRQAPRADSEGVPRLIPPGFPEPKAGEQRAPLIERRQSAEPTAMERRLAQRRTELSQKYNLPEDHPAIQENVALHREARTDALTGLANKRGWDEMLATLGESDHVIQTDQKQFKPVNDRFGHEAGNMILRRQAQIVRDVLGDETSRFGGDEFGGIVRNATPERLTELENAIRERAANSPMTLRNPKTGETLDIPGFEVHIARGATAEAADLAVNDVAAASRAGGRGDVALPGDADRIPPVAATPGPPSRGLGAGPAELAPPPPRASVSPDLQAQPRTIRPIPPPAPRFSPGDAVVVSVSGRQQKGILIQSPDQMEATGPQLRGRAKVRLPSGKSVFVKASDIAPSPVKLNVTPNPPRAPRPATVDKVGAVARETYGRPLVQETREQVAGQMERATSTAGPVDTTAKPPDSPFNLDRMNLTRENKELLGRMYEAAPDKYEAAKGGRMTFEQFREMGVKIGGIVSPEDFERALRQGAPLSDPGMVVYAKELAAERARQMGKAKSELDRIMAEVGSAPTERADRIMLEDAQHRFLEASLHKANLDLTLAGAQAQAARTLTAFAIISEERGPLEKILTRMFNESC